MSKKKILNTTLKVVNYILWLVGAYLLVSTVGALEWDHITCTEAFQRTLAAAACLGLGWWLHDGIRMHLDD